MPEAASSVGARGTPLSVEDAFGRAIAAACSVSGVETLPLDLALGRVLADPVAAAWALPPFDNSAMDGYALRLADLIGDGPWTLSVAHRIAAGDPAPDRLAPGACARVFTGAPVPAGADAVVRQECVARHGDRITMAERLHPGRNIRHRGEDVAKGAAPRSGRPPQPMTS